MKKTSLLTVLVFLAGAVLPEGAMAEKDRKIEREFETKPGKTIEFDLDAGGDIAIEGWDKDLVHVEALLRGEDNDNIDIDFYMGRSGLEISSEFKRKRKRNRSDVNFIVRIPVKYDVEFNTLGGDIEIRGVEGIIKGSTMGGDVDFSDLKGELSVTTMGGDVSVRDSYLDGRVKTMGGRVDIENVEGDLRGYTMGGDVEYRNVRGRKDDEKEVSITTLGGDLDLDYEGRDIKARTMGGDIDLGKGEKVRLSTMGGDIDVLEARKGADLHTMGGDITIGRADIFAEAKTMGGDIEIKEVDGWVKATTMGGDVHVKMVGGPDDKKRDVELKSMGGDIELTVPEGMSMDFDIEIAYTKKSKRNYRIESDFDMKIEETKEWKSRWGQKRKYIYGTGVIRDGANSIKIRTTNGNVRIKKGD
ncbi:MAG: DUF4097 family beta strand repeat protein [Candidatus Krumholzibacteriota bacterium]|nr:DUF4097 family beta strand repeat protein [Candidatus Krumholzibacteriota bacterium]